MFHSLCTDNKDILKQIKSYCRNNIGRILFSIFLIVIIVISSRHPFIFLNENQILYLFSTCASIIASLFGLIFAGYTFFYVRLHDQLEIMMNELDMDDNNSFNTFRNKRLYRLKKDYSKSLLYITTGCVFVVLFCFLSIAICPNSHSWKLNVIMNSCGVMTMCTAALMIQFVLRIVDPDNLIREKVVNFSRFQKGYFPTDTERVFFLEQYELLRTHVIERCYNISTGKVPTSSSFSQFNESINYLKEECNLGPVNFEKLQKLRQTKNLIKMKESSPEINVDLHDIRNYDEDFFNTLTLHIDSITERSTTIKTQNRKPSVRDFFDDI